MTRLLWSTPHLRNGMNFTSLSFQLLPLAVQQSDTKAVSAHFQSSTLQSLSSEQPALARDAWQHVTHAGNLTPCNAKKNSARLVNSGKTRTPKLAERYAAATGHTIDAGNKPDAKFWQTAAPPVTQSGPTRHTHTRTSTSGKTSSDRKDPLNTAD